MSSSQHMGEDHAILARLDERSQSVAAQISSINHRLARFETKLEAIELRLVTLNGHSHRTDLINRSTSAVGGGGIVATIVAVLRLMGVW